MRKWPQSYGWHSAEVSGLARSLGAERGEQAGPAQEAIALELRFLEGPLRAGRAGQGGVDNGTGQEWLSGLV